MSGSNVQRDFVGILTSTLIYAHVADRAKFNSIHRRCIDHDRRLDGSRVVTKRVEDDGFTVVFHHWIRDTAVSRTLDVQIPSEFII
jgi:hypothetical protein